MLTGRKFNSLSHLFFLSTGIHYGTEIRVTYFSGVQPLFHSRTSNNIIFNLLQEGALLVMIKLHHLKEESLEKDNSFTV